MKTKNYLKVCRGAIALLALVPLALNAAETAGATTAQKGAPSTHVLFTGLDIQVHHKGALHRVRGVEGDAFIIKVGDRNVKIPMGLKPEEVKASPALLLADRSASVTNFKHDRAYTPANDPIRKWSSGMMATGAMHDAAAHAETNLAHTPKMNTVTDRSVVTMMGFGTKEVANPQYAVAEARALNAASLIGGNMGSMDVYAEKIADEEAQELYDALDVEFEVSAAKRIRNPYLVVTATYHEKGDEKYVRKWLFAKALDPIEAEPSKVFVQEAGFPRGFVVKKLQVHLYENGVEIPTDLSENRAPLTRDETHEYLVIEHLNAHKADTMPAQLVLMQLPEDWAMRPRDESFRKTYFIKVDQEGRPVGLSEDEAGKTKVADSYYEGVLKGLRFLPALAEGRAVPSVVGLKPVELSM